MFSVLYCGKKYMVKGLEDVCREFISAQIDRDSVFEILEQVHRLFHLSGRISDMFTLNREMVKYNFVLPFSDLLTQFCRHSLNVALMNCFDMA